MLCRLGSRSKCRRRRGDKLVEIDTTEMQRDVRQKKLALKNAEAEVRRVKAELEILKEENITS